MSTPNIYDKSKTTDKILKNHKKNDHPEGVVKLKQLKPCSIYCWQPPKRQK